MSCDQLSSLYNSEMSVERFPSLYCLCLKIAVVDCASSCKFCKKEFRLLPDNVLFDFYNKVRR